jgi:hypothetical protein
LAQPISTTARKEIRISSARSCHIDFFSWTEKKERYVYAARNISEEIQIKRCEIESFVTWMDRRRTDDFLPRLFLIVFFSLTSNIVARNKAGRTLKDV